MNVKIALCTSWDAICVLTLDQQHYKQLLLFVDQSQDSCENQPILRPRRYNWRVYRHPSNGGGRLCLDISQHIHLYK